VDDLMVAAVGWWAGTIYLAVDEADADSRRWLAEATGDPQAWEAFVPWAGGDGRRALAAFLLQLAESLESHGTALPLPSGPGYDPLRARGDELARRLVRGLLAGDPACQPR
jgi:hypothetical protein